MNRLQRQQEYKKDAGVSYGVIAGGRAAHKMLSYVFLFTGVTSAVIYIFFENILSPSFAMLTKLVPNLLMAAWLMLCGLKKGRWIVFVGVIFALLCDMWMQLDRPPLTLIMGIASNLLAFVMYTAFFFVQDREADYKWIVPPAIIFAGLYLVLYPHLDANMRIPVLVYTLSYIVFLWRADSLLAHDNTHAFTAFIGAVMIAVSDGILSFRLFYDIGHSTLYRAAIMLLWWGGILAVCLYARKAARL